MALILVLLATSAAVLVALYVEQDRFEDRQRGRAGVAAQATRAAVDGVVGSLSGSAGLVGEDGRIRASPFRRFADELLLARTTNAVSYAERVPDAARAAFERRTGRPITDVLPRGGYRRALRRNVHVATVAARPARVRQALGFDVLGDPNRRTAVLAARDLGRTQLSRPLRLLASRTVGLIGYKPLYRTGLPMGTRAARRRAFSGVVSASFSAQAIREAVLSQFRVPVDLRILDRDEVVTGPARPLDGGEHVAASIAGRPWTIEVAGGDSPSPFPPIVLGLAGLLVALLVDARMRQFALQRQAVIEQRRLADQREIALVQQRFLAEAGTVLDLSLDVQATLQALADLAVPELAGWCAVALVQPGGWESVAVAHSDPAKLALAEELERRWPPEKRTDQGVGKVLLTGDPELHAEIPDELLAEVAQDEEHLAVIRSLGMASAMIVPLVARGRILGALTLIADDPDRHYTVDDLDHAEQIARRAALAVDNAQLHERTVRTAQTLQAGLLPAALPVIPAVALAARYHPSGEDTEVGGDFYDVHALGSGRWAVTVGDVCGKGAEAAALTALIRYTLRAVAEDGPAGAIKRLNEAVLHQRPDGTFATLVHVQFEPDGEDLRLHVGTAGHPQPVVRRADGTLELLGGCGPLVGAFSDLEWGVHEAVLRPGDAVALYTDGVTEAQDRPLSPAELLGLLADAPAGAEGLADALEHVALDAPRAGRDDVAVLVLERLSPTSPTLHHLPADAQAPGLARTLIEPHLQRLASERREAARLLVTETVTNAVRHGTPPHAPIELHIEDLPGGVRFEVRDRGAGMSAVPDPPPLGSAGGYGLQLVQELSDRWGWRGDQGTAVWFELDAAVRPTSGP